MIDTRAARQEFQDQVLAAARKGQQRLTSTVRTMTATAQMIRPQLPSLPTPGQLRDKAPSLMAKLPTADQLREKAPTFIAKLPTPDQLREKAPTLIAKLPTSDQLRDKAPALRAKLPTTVQIREKLPTTQQLRSGAEEFTAGVISVQRQVFGQVAAVATPLAKQAAAVFSQAGSTAAKLPAGLAAGANGASRVTKADAEPVTHATGTAEPATSEPAKAQSAKSASAKTQSAKSGPASTSKTAKTAKSSSTAKRPAAKPASRAKDAS